MSANQMRLGIRVMSGLGLLFLVTMAGLLIWKGPELDWMEKAAGLVVFCVFGLAYVVLFYLTRRKRYF